jgi:hypothetical protein
MRSRALLASYIFLKHNKKNVPAAAAAAAGDATPATPALCGV